MKPRSHQIAQAAYACVVARQTFSEKKAYGALAHKLPTLILQNGLAQATGFLLAKGKEEHLALLDDLARLMGVPNGKAFHHEKIIEADIIETMMLTRHCLDAAGWIKRYVQGVLKVDATGEENDNA